MANSHLPYSRRWVFFSPDAAKRRVCSELWAQKDCVWWGLGSQAQSLSSATPTI